jgi:SAM-dependent methyltransferase
LKRWYAAIKQKNMTEFWETSFKDKQEMWGWQPADSVFKALALFKEHRLKKILIPGFGYGRNAKTFIDNGFDVTGIEISETAIGIAKQHFGETVKIYHGSVGVMPFEKEKYDGIFCYALIHLLDEKYRVKLIQDCFNQLKPDGYMVFVTISKNDFRFGQGVEISKDTFEPWKGLTLFFYDSNSIKLDFNNFGLVENTEITEPEIEVKGKPIQKFWYILCKKENGL